MVNKDLYIIGLNQPYRATRKSFKPQLDSTLLMQNSDLAERYNIAVENAFSVLGDLPEDPEEAWSITRDTILTTAAENIPLAHDRDHGHHRPEEGSTT